MGGCSNCAGKSGCQTHKSGMLATVADWMEKLYPSKAWGHLDDEVALRSGPEAGDVLALSEELSQELKAATIYREGGEADSCDFVYVLCQGREPSALQVRYGGAPTPAEWSAEDRFQEYYLRLAISSIAPLAVVQQVALSVSMVDGSWLASEELSPGVYDAPLLKRFQRLVAILPAYDLTHLDMGEISAPPPGYDDSAYREIFQRPAHQVNYLFFREPSNMTTTGLLTAPWD